MEFKCVGRTVGGKAVGSGCRGSDGGVGDGKVYYNNNIFVLIDMPQ